MPKTTIRGVIDPPELWEDYVHACERAGKCAAVGLNDHLAVYVCTRRPGHQGRHRDGDGEWAGQDG